MRSHPSRIGDVEGGDALAGRLQLHALGGAEY